MRLALLLAAGLAAAAAQAQLPELTAEERAWLARNPVLRVGVDRAGAPPIDVVGSDGNYYGISAEVLRRVANRLDARLEIRLYKDRVAVLEAARRREVDVVPSMLRSPAAARDFRLTQHYLYSHSVLLKQPGFAGTAVPSVAVVRGREPAEALAARLRAWRPVEMADALSAIAAVAEGRVDAYAGARLPVEHALARGAPGALANLAEEALDAGELHLAVRADLPLLASALDKGLASFAPPEIAAIARSWLPRDDGATPRVPVFVVRPDERRRLDGMGALRVAFDADFEPFSFLQGGEPVGMSIDYLRAAAERLGVEVEVGRGSTFAEALDAVRGGGADVLAAAARTPGRRRELRFAGPTFSQPTAIITRLETEQVTGLADLEPQRVALPDGYFLRERLAREYPQARIDSCRDTEDCLRAVVDGRAVATLGNLAVISALIERRFPGRLRVAGTIPDAPSELYFAVHRDRPELQALLQRALDSLSPERHAQIRARWRTATYQEGITFAEALRYGVPAIAIVALILGIVVFSNRRLEREVARRRATEAELRTERDRAEAATQAKSSFLAVMSHEIRTPMHGVLGILDVLGHTPLSPDQQGLVKTAGASARSLLTLLNDLLDFSKIEAGKMRLEESAADLRLVAESALNLFAMKAFDKGVRLELFIDPGLAESHRFDEVRVGQVLTNLVSNAVKFTSAGKVSVEIEAADAAPGAQLVRIRVADTGIGIDAAAQAGLFQPFQQAEGSTTRRYGGSGLGLAICRRIAELMGAELALESAKGAGCRFTFSARLPVAAPASRAAALSGLRVTLAISDESTRLAVTRYLHGWNATVREVAAHQAAPPGEPAELLLTDEPSLAGAARAAAAQAPILALRASPLPGTVHVDERWLEISTLPLRVTALEAALRELAGGASADGAAQARPLAGAKVLVVEDHPVNQLVVRRQLEMLGHSVTIAGDGLEGLERWRDGSFDIVFADHHMPNMDGDEMVRRLREEERARGSRRIPVVELSADGREAMEGVDARLLKPVVTAELARVIEERLPRLARERRGAGEAPRPPFDEALLAESSGDEPAIVEMLLALRASVEQDMAEARAALRERRMEDARRLAHRMLGAARAVGAGGLARTAAALQEACRSSDFAAAAGAFEALERAREEVASAVEARERALAGRPDKMRA